MDPEKRLVVGIDFSKNRADFALLQPDGQPLEVHCAFANSLSGFQQAKALLLKTLGEHQFGGLDIAGEATNYYWLPFYQHLAEDPELKGYHPELFLFNARWVRWYKKSLSPDNKEDLTDPQYIADRLRFKRPPQSWKLDTQWLPVRFYTRLRKHLTKSLVRSKNLAQVYLFLAYSAYTRYKPFSDSFSLTSQRLLTRPEPLSEFSDWDLEALAAELDTLSGHRLRNACQNARTLKQVLAESFPPHQTLVAPLQAVLEVLLETINSLQGQIQQVERLLEAHLEQGYPEIAWLDSIPGIGRVFACGIAAEIGDIQRFVTVPKWDKKRRCLRPRWNREIEDAVAKYAGLWWPKNASGAFSAEERPMSREGNAYLRYYILEAAESMRRSIPSYARYYQKKYDESVKHKHKRALVLTGRKALGLFVGLLLRQEVYQEKEVSTSSP